MQFDMVVSDTMEYLFSGTPEEVKRWIEEIHVQQPFKIWVGETLEIMSPADYMSL